MQLCDNGHDEVAFAGSWSEDCPACAALESLREEMQKEIDDLQTELDEHECE